MTGVEWYNTIANATSDMVTVKNDKVIYNVSIDNNIKNNNNCNNNIL